MRFPEKYFPDSGVWVSDPTWENHIAIFEGAGFRVETYPWFAKRNQRCARVRCWKS
ncbi:aminotransferase class I/II-fold pyridoxal phosphate-dependent enzyme [Shigella flexneri]